MDLPRLRAAAEGCDAIFHAAALVTTRSASWPLFQAANVEGTRNAIAAAEASGAKLVQVSSVAVYGGASRYRDTPTDEGTPLAPLPERAFYARSKRESEALVMEAHAQGRIWGTAVRPDVIYGRYDRQFVPRIAPLMQRGVFPLIGGGRAVMAIVHAANVADGAVRTVDAPLAGGRAYNLANDFDVTVADFVRLGAIGLGTARGAHARSRCPWRASASRRCAWGCVVARGESASQRCVEHAPFPDARQSVHVGARAAGARLGATGAAGGGDRRMRSAGGASSGGRKREGRDLIGRALRASKKRKRYGFLAGAGAAAGAAIFLVVSAIFMPVSILAMPVSAAGAIAGAAFGIESTAGASFPLHAATASTAAMTAMRFMRLLLE